MNYNFNIFHVKNFNQLRSPDTSLVLDISLDNGILSYSLKKDNKNIIDKSVLGMKTDKFEFFDNLIIKNKQYSSSNSNWSQVWGEQKVIKDHFNQLSVVLKSSKTSYEMKVHFRLYDDGLGFRYEIEEQSEIDSFKLAMTFVVITSLLSYLFFLRKVKIN